MNELAQRRAALVARSQAERAAIIDKALPLLRKAAAADRMYMRVRRHPIVVTVVSAAVVILGARKLFDVATSIFAVYALLRKR